MCMPGRPPHYQCVSADIVILKCGCVVGPKPRLKLASEVGVCQSVHEPIHQYRSSVCVSMARASLKISVILHMLSDVRAIRSITEQGGQHLSLALAAAADAGRTET